MSAERKKIPGPEENTYFVDDDHEARERDLERIRFQSKTGFNGPTQEFLKSLGLEKENTEIALDIGAGAGDCIPLLAEVAQKVIAVDNDSSRFENVEKTIEAFSLNNQVELLEGSVADLREIPSDYVSLVHTRLFWQHLSSDARRRGAQEMVRILKPGGILMAEDLILGDAKKNPEEIVSFGWQVYPPSEALTRLQKAFISTYIRRGTEPSMGAHLEPLFNEIGLETKKRNAYVITSQDKDPYKYAHIKLLETVGVGIVKMGFMTEEEFNNDLDEFSKHILDPNTSAFGPFMVQLAFQKSTA